MSEADIRRAIAEAKQSVPASAGRLRKAALSAALGLGLAALSACYGGPMPRPPAGDHGLQGNAPTAPAKP